MREKQILITSYKYSPEITPRAFRTLELTKEFSRRGYHVDLFIPDTEQKNDKNEENVTKYCIQHNISFNDVKQNKSTSERKKIYRKIRSIIGNLLKYLTGDRVALRYTRYLRHYLLQNSINKKYDAIISIGLPFYIHLATAIFIKKTNQECVTIADYGDPFYYNPEFPKVFYLKYVEKWTLKYFKYITIPTLKSIQYYTCFKERNFIKVIPQGFNFSNVVINKYNKNDCPTFCYAGIFYRNIRNPEYLFEYLDSIDTDFKFVIYTRLHDHFCQEIVDKYKDKLGHKLVLKNFIPREQLIKEMSNMDFLINLENYNSGQVPSKLIDYALSGRPILSLAENKFDKEVFEKFLNGNYDEQTNININDFDIRKVVDQFENLINSN